MWGEPSEKVIIAIHGDQSNKMDTPIELFAKAALSGGYQVVSFDLPEHGERKNEDIPCKVQNCIKDLGVIMDYVKRKWKHISLFANSIGAYFSLLAYKSEGLENVWFLSPVVNMQRIIENMMMWFQVTKEQLEKERIISLPIGKHLYWDYYCYVKEHPIVEWKVPTNILYGSKDDLCDQEIIVNFAKKFSCKLKVVQDGEHYFHTPQQLQALNKWLEETI